MMGVFCEVCGNHSGGYAIEVPNLNRVFCKKCGFSRDPMLKTYHFCSWECLKDFVELFHSKFSKGVVA